MKQLKLLVVSTILLSLFATITSCIGTAIKPAPVKLYWKTWLREGHSETTSSVYPIRYLYNEMEGVLYIRGVWDLTAAIDIQNRKILWRKFNTFNNNDAPLYKYKDMVFTLIYDEDVWKTWFSSQPYIVGIDKKTGEIKWKYILESGEALFCGFTLKNGYIYTPDKDPEATSVSTEGILKKIDIETKEVVWEVRGLEPLRSVRPVIDDESGLVFVGNLPPFHVEESTITLEPSTFYAFEDKGEEVELKWKRILEDDYAGIFAEPIVYGDSVYVIARSGKFYRLKKDTGEIVWHTDFREECPKYKEESAIHFWGSTYIYNDKYLITVEIGVIGIVAIDINTGKVVWVHPGYGALWGIYLDEKEGKIYAHGWSDVLECIDAETGKLIWRYDYENGYMRLEGAPYKVGKYIIDGDTSNYLYVLEEYE